MFTGTRFPDSCNGTTNPVQQLIVNVLADQWCWSSTFWLTNDHISSTRSLHAGTSNEKPDRDSNNIKCPRSPTNIGIESQKPSPWKLLTRQTSLLETSASTCKDPMLQQSKELGPVKLEASLVQRWIKIHAAEKRWPYTCLQMPEWEVSRKCDDVGCHILRHKFSTAAHSRQP